MSRGITMPQIQITYSIKTAHNAKLKLLCRTARLRAMLRRASGHSTKTYTTPKYKRYRQYPSRSEIALLALIVFFVISFNLRLFNRCFGATTLSAETTFPV